jgi:sulfide:quinone oxidoreductase
MQKAATVLIVGGGAAGVSAANNMRRRNSKIDITLIEPSEDHYYQPAFTLVGGGEYKLKNARKKLRKILHSSVNWIQDKVATFQPEQNAVTLASGEQINYHFLIVCPGIQVDYHKIKGLTETLGKNGVCCNYSSEHVEYTWENVDKLRAGTALFTQPPMPIKCAGAPQKAMYLAADRFRQKGIDKNINVEFFNAGPGMFGVPFFAKALSKVVKSYNIKTNFQHNLVEVDGPKKLATFEAKDADGNVTTITRHFDMIHVTPPQSAPDFIKQSPLADDAGWIDVDKNTLQHNKYLNIFGLGDATSTPNAKTAAAVRKQVPVAVDNIFKLIKSQGVTGGYDGYGSCPLTTSLGGVMLAEFSYGGTVTPSFPCLDPRKNRFLWWLGKKAGFPWLYWIIMIKGRRIDIPHRAQYAKDLVDADS